MSDTGPSEFERAANEGPSGGLLSDFWYFLKTEKKWWLVPILVILLLFAVVFTLAGTGLAPLIYPFW